MSTNSSNRLNNSSQHTVGRGSTLISKSMSPLKMTAEKMQMVRRDIKPGNGTSLISYQNYANLKKHLSDMKPIVDDRPSETYLKEKIAGPDRYAHNQTKKMNELKKENSRLFGRLLNIYEKKIQNVQ